MPDFLLRTVLSWRVLLAGMVLGAAIAVIYVDSVTPIYVSTAKVYVTVRPKADNVSLVDGSKFAKQQMESYVEVATSPLVMMRAAASLGIGSSTETLTDKVTANSPEGTAIIILQVTDSEPERAVLINNAVADATTRAIGTLEQSSTSSSSPVHALVIQRGKTPDAPISPKPVFTVGLGGILGLFLGILLVARRDARRSHINNSPNVQRIGALPVLGTFQCGLANVPTSVDYQITASPSFDAFRQMRTNLQPLMDVSSWRTVAVTSASATEGKTTVAIGLASAFSEAGARVLLIDGDLRVSLLSLQLGVSSHQGLSTALSGLHSIEGAIMGRNWCFDFIPAGTSLDNPSSLLTASRLGPAIQTLRRAYDVVLVDTPATSAFDDTARICALIDFTVLVAKTSCTTSSTLRKAVTTVQSAGGRVAGAALNIAPRGSPLIHFSMSDGVKRRVSRYS